MESSTETASKENTAIVEDPAVEKETEIDGAVREIVEDLVLSACRSSPDDGDVPGEITAPMLIVDDNDRDTEKTSGAVDENGLKDDCTTAVTDSQKANGAEISLDTFRQQVGWLEPKVMTPREFTRWQRRRRLAAVW
ncbi:uncharacterized protein LOC126549982 [Aphis gossypii]|uniref:uncharacterized protein LOC126549982 n=1 Tax=Aphis gossypii TaxID=80765 RepID=UPI00215929DF|nr:uncharacterized protein LOC126549982 [Aphis gossypii]